MNLASAAPPAQATRPTAPHPHRAEAFLQQRYGSQQETGITGDAVQAAGGGQALSQSPKVQRSAGRGGEGLVLVDDDA